MSYELVCEGVPVCSRDCATLPARGEIIDLDDGRSFEVIRVRRDCVSGKPDRVARVLTAKCHPLTYGKESF